MIVLCGFPISNYYNKVKLALLEKGIAFSEENVGTGSADPAVLAASPLAKIPFIRTDAGTLCESQAILEYLEDAHPEPALLPADPFAAAKVRELVTFIDLHVELVARELYPKAFFGGTISEANAERVRKVLVRNIAALKQLARFSPYVAGPEFTQADCAAWATLPVVSMATKLVYGDDLLAAGGLDWKPYHRFVGERPSAQRVTEDRKAWQDRAAASKG
jgi:glutathione S-transferase